MIGLRVGIAAGVVARLAAGIGADPISSGGRTLIVIAGQSNAQTLGLVTDLTDASYAAEYPRVRYISKQDGNTNPPVWTEHTIQSLDAIVYAALDRVGFEVSLLRDLDRSTPNDYAVVRFALGSTSSVNWDPAGTYPTLDPPNLFTQFVAYIRAAMSATGSSRIVLVWQHGENDAGNETTANAYDTWLGTFIDALRFQFPGMPAVLAKLNADCAQAFTTELRASQVAYAATATDVELIDIDSITIAGGDYDGVHYLADGYVAIGHLLSPGAAAALGRRIVPNASFTSAPTGLSVQFTDTSTSPGSSVVAWLWTFGDGTTSTEQSPLKVYAETDTYDVTLRATNAAGDSNTTAVTPVAVSGGITGVTRDATSGIYVPADATEWTTFLAAVGLSGLGNPNSCWQMQEASGNLADSIGSLTLTAAGTPSYQQTVTGWDRKGVAIAAGGVHRFAAASGVGPNPATTSQTWVWFTRITATPTAFRTLAGISNGAPSFGCGANNVPIPQAIINGVTASGASNPVGQPTGPWVLLYDRTGSRAQWHTPQEKIVATYAAVATGIKGWGANGGTCPAADCVYGFMYSGAAAEMTDANLKLLLTAMGFTVSWT